MCKQRHSYTFCEAKCVNLFNKMGEFPIVILIFANKLVTEVAM